ncbi:N-acetyltransferase [Paludibacter sp. 221]|uniref:GNAT family N-acetyltransferase n=1 Tax=Paludibacter sp. 221 TaxID=2302939 RepID=UPI0013D4B5E5|nr:GNAT family protein [Paludibacter sp. 221]NDV47729.1 N-acetyltransferase [Paludibacter sp. 221]
MRARRELIIDAQITLKEISLDEVQPIFTTLVRERNYFSEWLPFVEYTKEVSDTLMFVEQTIHGDPNNLTCAIYFENQFVGLVGLKDTDVSNNKTEIGYWLSEGFQKRGIMTRACRAIIEYAFDEMGMNRVQLKAATGNIKSQQVAERLGFKREGIEREGELHSRGYVDLVVFGVLKSEWK